MAGLTLPTSRLARALGALVVLGSVAAACTRPAEQLDRRATEQAVGRAVAARVEPEVVRTTCPADMPRGTGERVSCRVQLADVERELRVTVTQKAGAGRLTIVIDEAVVDPARIEIDLQQKLMDRFNRAFLVDCGDPGALVVPVGHQLVCRSADKDTTKTIEATVTDLAGTMRYRIR